jgi:predicted transposase/invertase (TIGR01784 family)
MDNDILLPRSDLVFKLIFGDARNTDILAGFLQAVLDLPVEEYGEISIVDPNLRQESEDDKLGILDVLITTKSGKIINVEIQVERIPQMRERVIFYTSKLVTQQIKKSEAYRTIKRVVCIVITNHVLIPENGDYHNRFTLYDPKTKTQLTELLEIDSLELPKLPDRADSTELWNWLRFLRAERREELDMIAKTNPQIQKAVGVLMELSADERTRLQYEYREKARLDKLSQMLEARDEGKLEGKLEGKAEGKLEGIAEGKLAEKNEIARNALKKGMPVGVIANITGLTHEEIERLEQEV